MTTTINSTTHSSTPTSLSTPTAQTDTATAHTGVLRACPVCQAQQAAPLYRPRHSPGPVGRCLECGMVYISQIDDARALIFEGPANDAEHERLLNSSNLNDLADCWEMGLLPSKEAEWPSLLDNAVEHLQRMETYLTVEQRRVLDFGCGWGFFLAAAKERGWQAHGLEPLPGHAVYARAKFGLDVLTDTLREDSFAPASFDAVTAFQVFEHIPDPVGDVQRLHRLLKPEGLVLIEVPNIATWGVSLLKGRHRHFVQDHLNFFSAETLSDLLTRQGFKILASYQPTRRMSYRHLVSIWGQRVLPGPLAKAAQSATQKMGLWDQSLRVNLGDIVAVLARKQ